MTAVLPPEFFNIAGIIGAIFYLGAYGALNTGFVRGEGYLYPTLNLIGSGCVLISLAAYFNPFSVVIETCWVLLSLFGIARLYVLTRGLRFTEEERRFLDAALPGLSRLTARRFLSAGRWADAAPGTVLTTEDAPVERLTYLASGSARVTHGAVEIAQIPEGLFVGELGVLTRAPATATVTLAEPSRTFSIDAAPLADLSRRYPDLKLALDASVGVDARRKILAGNRRIRAMAGSASAAGADPAG